VLTGAGLSVEDGAEAARWCALNALSVALDARLPRAVPIDVDLSAVPVNNRVLFLAIGGSSVDPCTAPPVGLPANPTVVDLVKCWPYAALRMVRLSFAF